jgi:hypothetical protein
VKKEKVTEGCSRVLESSLEASISDAKATACGEFFGGLLSKQNSTAVTS